MAWLQIDFQSNSLCGNTRLDVFLPAETPPMLPPRPAGSLWKTVYLLHGFSGDSTHWLLNSNIQELSQRCDLAFVMLSGSNSFYLDGASSAARYSTFIKEAVDFTRRVLPLSRERGDTTIAGLSMGGYGAVYNGLRWHETFGHIIALSSAFVLDQVDTATDEPNFLGLNRAYFLQTFGEHENIMLSDRNPAILAAKLMSEETEPIDLYMACGTEDFLLAPNRDVKKSLEETGFLFTYEEGPGTHDWAFWTPYLSRGLDRIGWLKPPPPSIFG
ncbi:MAG: acetylesterase [Oscillospiraceae bacterium]|jgi:S-formylglutathione hydrolase FrmB|nr:acetylesterase [Oscillospiraceae bacterium]